MHAIFELPSTSPLARSFTEEGGLIPLRVPHGWTVIHNTLAGHRGADGTVEVNDSEDLYWARTAPPPWATPAEGDGTGNGDGDDDLRNREINIDAGWYEGRGFRVVVLTPDWDHVHASHSTADLEEFVATLERWMSLITERGELPESATRP